MPIDPVDLVELESDVTVIFKRNGKTCYAVPGFIHGDNYDNEDYTYCIKVYTYDKRKLKLVLLNKHFSWQEFSNLLEETGWDKNFASTEEVKDVISHIPELLEKA